MLTRKSLNKLLDEVMEELIQLDITPNKMILFGSYATGGVHAYSDVDVALWSEKFTGEPLGDFDHVRPIVRKHHEISFKLYPAYATASEYDPFIEIIEQTGICIYEQEKQT
ncbi:MAG: nucleotidyltransferase domain-containing protein [Segetibacter sp.]|nr:nucleotidyltransferase domain-containing protein [Segetibacter sp.]